MRNMQETFDFVATHLFKQGTSALSPEGVCMYRDSNGRSCAVGCQIPDERYLPEMEFGVGGYLGASFKDLMIKFDLKDIFSRETFFLNEALQEIHDEHDNWLNTDNMKFVLIQCARKFNLDYSILDTLSFENR